MFVKRFDVARSLLTISFQCRTEDDFVTSVSMTLNIDYQQLSANDKDELADEVQASLATSAGVDQSAVSVTLTPGSVKVDVEIRTADANSAESIEKSMKETNIAQEVLGMDRTTVASNLKCN